MYVCMCRILDSMMSVKACLPIVLVGTVSNYVLYLPSVYRAL